MKPRVEYRRIAGLSYEEAWSLQTEVQGELIALKRKNRDLKQEERKRPIHKLIFCEHSPVYTLGKSGSIHHLLIDEEQRNQKGIEFFKINRGGDITYHGPGQITGYPIFDLDEFFTDIHKYVRLLEEVVIKTISHYGIIGTRVKDFTGVWIEPSEDLIDRSKKPRRKICAIGVHLSRWVTMHGFALNVNTDLQYFKNIVPCGIVEEDKTVTSIEKEIGKKVDINEVEELLKYNFSSLFGFDFI